MEKIHLKLCSEWQSSTFHKLNFSLNGRRHVVLSMANIDNTVFSLRLVFVAGYI